MMLRGRVVLCALLWVAIAAFGGGQDVQLYAQQSAPQQTDEFVPIDELPPQDQLPAAPLLVAAYSFVVVALFLYVVSVARRLDRVQRELTRLESDVKRSGQR
jgi:CcmD family protein